MRKLGRAHRSGALGDALGDIDMSSIVVSQSSIDAESAAFDGRLNAWLLDYAGSAASLPASFVQQVDDFVSRWRAQKDAFYWFQTSRLTDLINSEAEFNKLRDQYLGYGHQTAITPATVIANGQQVRADQIPAGSSWSGQIVTVLKWGGAIGGGIIVLKIIRDARLLGRLTGAGAP